MMINCLLHILFFFYVYYMSKIYSVLKSVQVCCTQSKTNADVKEPTFPLKGDWVTNSVLLKVPTALRWQSWVLIHAKSTGAKSRYLRESLYSKCYRCCNMRSYLRKHETYRKAKECTAFDSPRDRSPRSSRLYFKTICDLSMKPMYVNCPLFMGDVLQYEVGGSSSSFCSFLWQLFLYLLSPVLCWYYQFLCFSPDIQVKRSARTSSFKALHSNAIWLLGILK